MSGFVVLGVIHTVAIVQGGNSYFFHICMKNSSLGSSSKNGPMGNAQYGVFLCCNMDLAMASLTSLPLVLSLKKKKLGHWHIKTLSCVVHLYYDSVKNTSTVAPLSFSNLRRMHSKIFAMDYSFRSEINQFRVG